MKRVLVNYFLISCLVASFAELIATVIDEAIAVDVAISYAVLGFYILAIIFAIPFAYIVGRAKSIAMRTYLPVLMWLAIPSSIIVTKFDESALTLAVVGVVLNLYAFWERWKLSGHASGWFSDSYFSDSIRNSGRGVAVLFAVLVSLAVTVSVNAYNILEEVLKEVGDGNVVLKPSGIYGKIKTYRKENKTVYLISMAHVGDQKFYSEVLNEIPMEKSVVLLEGVKDSREQIFHDLGHKVKADSFGLKTQSEFFRVDNMKGRVIQYADKDIADMSPEAQKYVEYTNTKDMSSLLSIVRNRSDSEEVRVAKEIFQKERNDHLLSFFDYLVPKYDRLIIPWGAAHISTFASALEERGYIKLDEREAKIIGF